MIWDYQYNQHGKEFTSTSVSNSNWVPKNNGLSIINYESTDYNIINSKIKRTFEGSSCIKSLANVDQNKMMICSGHDLK